MLTHVKRVTEWQMLPAAILGLVALSWGQFALAQKKNENSKPNQPQRSAAPPGRQGSSPPAGSPATRGVLQGGKERGQSSKPSANQPNLGVPRINLGQQGASKKSGGGTFPGLNSDRSKKPEDKSRLNLPGGLNLQGKPQIGLPEKEKTGGDSRLGLPKIDPRLGLPGNLQGDLSKQRGGNLPKDAGKLLGKDLNSNKRLILDLPIGKNGQVNAEKLKGINIKPARLDLSDRIKGGDLRRLTDSQTGKNLKLDRQFSLLATGDTARRLNLVSDLNRRGGWRHRHFGVISNNYVGGCFGMWYSGPGFCSSYCWYPTWHPWVDWCWWDSCDPLWDPRPTYCQPVIYHPCPTWTVWDYPVWRPLPVVVCGTWVDVPSVVIDEGLDLQLLAVRFVDPGHPEQNLGPRYRVWLRNNSPRGLAQPFNAMLLAGNSPAAAADLPQAGARITGMEPGQILPVDIRLPVEANQMSRSPQGHKVPFSHLHVLVDSHNEIPEAFEPNNGFVLARGDVLPVDPSSFAADPTSAGPGGVVTLAGEGFGPEPGQVVIHLGGLELQAEILGWYDLGVQIKLPSLALASGAQADLLVVRGDGAAANPLTIEIGAPRLATPAGP